jgi:putative membrane-bound dehydrogenase-like protein
MKSCFVIALLFFVAASSLMAADPTSPEVDPKELPRIQPVAPEDAISTIEVRPGFKVEMAAHEPQVVDPVAACFDEDGALFVVEMRGYSERREESLGRVRKLTDTDGDGFYETATIYAKDLKWPTGVLCYDGGIYVTASPDILYFKDTNGDGESDERSVAFTGFGASRLNMQALCNSLRWGPDNRIWGATSNNGGTLRRGDEPEEKAVRVSGRDFSFDPKTHEFRLENISAQFGMSFDAFGNRYSCSNSHHLQAIMWEVGQVKPNPFFTMPAPRVDIPVDGPSAEVYRLSPDEPWRIIRTRWRIGGVVKGAVEGGGRVSGYFTGATGATIFTGDAYGPDYAGNAFTGDAGSNLVHRKVIAHPNGAVQPVATRGPGEEKREFLASTSNWFRPVNYANAPDGCLYILDMHREVIEHPWSIPEGIKKHIDLNSGWKKGRIFRVVPDGKNFERRRSPKLSEASDEELVALLDHANGWHRTTAQRLLWQRGAWKDEYHQKGPRVSDTTPRARFQKALALGSRDGEADLEQLVELFATAPDGDSWMEAAVLLALRSPEQAAFVFVALDSIGRHSLELRIAEMIGQMGDEDAGSIVLTKADAAGPSVRLALLAALARGSEKGGAAAKKLVLGQVETRLTEAATLAASKDSAVTDRRAAIGLLKYDKDDATLKMLRGMITESALTAAVLETLAARRDPQLAATLVVAWADLSGPTRDLAVGRLAARAEWATEFLQAVEAGKIERSTVATAQQKAYRGHKDGEVSKLATAIFPPPVDDRAKVMAAYEKALTLKGDAEKGQVKYSQICIACHRSGGQGAPVGPDMVTFKTAGKDSVLKNILDPNAEVAPQYVAYTVTLKNGEVLIGMIASEGSEDVTLRMPGGLERTVKRSEVKGMAGLGASLMPLGLEAQITVEEMADLLEYVATAEE